MSTLTLETLFTRIFSVTMWYHFAFLAISVAMLGLTVGAVLVYLHPRFRDAKATEQQLIRSAIGFALSIPIALALHLFIPFRGAQSLSAALSLLLQFAVLTLPFIFSGINLTLALTRYPGHFRRLYAFDLIGAALGCLAFIGLLALTDGVTAAIGIATLVALSAAVYASQAAKVRAEAMVKTLVTQAMEDGSALEYLEE